MKSALANQLIQHRFAFSIFACYLLGWGYLLGFSFYELSPSVLDSCARGMLVMPLLAGLLVTFIYCFTLLLFAVVVDKAFYWFLFAISGIVALSVLGVV